MRTTVTLDPDVEALLRSRMRERGLSFKEALNQAVRSALTSGGRQPTKKYVQRTYSMGFAPESALDHALTIAAALEDDEIVRKLSLRK